MVDSVDVQCNAVACAVFEEYDSPGLYSVICLSRPISIYSASLFSSSPLSLLLSLPLTLPLHYPSAYLPYIGIHLQTSSGIIWSPVLVIEPSGGANASFPRRQLFTRLKHKFFRHAHRIQVCPLPCHAMHLSHHILSCAVTLFHSAYALNANTQIML
jgi:hypothetical protein